MRLAEQYLESFGKIAKESNTMIIPANANDPASMVAQGMAIFKQINAETTSTAGDSSGTSELGFEPKPLPEVIAKLNEPNV
jgi:hypothetical protein|tara:strand:- start:39 stop:281 length:243 start_codon:yes stop_codon:yes gene_type:complete